MAPMTKTPQTKTPSKAGARQAWQFACTEEDGTFSDCGYLLRNHDLRQLVRFSSQHAKDSHGVEAPDAYFEGAAKKVAY
jgi:predicted small metal-binding protein